MTQCNKKMTRREVLRSGLLSQILLLPSNGTQAQSLTVDSVLKELSESVSDVEGAGRFKDYSEADGPAFARRPPRLSPSQRKISQKAVDLIEFFEVTGRSRYEALLSHPIWPGGESGVTIGVGYDLSSVSVAEFEREWQGYIGAPLISALSEAVGKRNSEANSMLARFSVIKISWDQAHSQFTRVTLPVFIAETERFYSNTEKLSSESLGALVSLVFNRGAGIMDRSDDPLQRRREMRKVQGLMDEGRFDQVPEQIFLMTRLWKDIPGAKGVVLRRKAEAALFQAGL